MTIDDLELHRVTFEARYPKAFLLWDQSGQVWSRMLSRYPNLVNRHAEPGKIIFADGQRAEMSLEVDKLFVMDHNPEPDLRGLSEFATDLVGIATESLGIEVFTRLGLRPIFWRSYKNPESASEAMRSTGMVFTPGGTQLGVSGDCIMPEYSVRKESKANGFSVRLKAETVEFKLDLRPEWRGIVESQTQTDFRLTLDIDYYTTAKEIAVDQFRASDWISSAYHLIRRDGSTFMKGE